MIRKIWGADPLRCPLCSGLLRKMALVETQSGILAILTPLGLARPHAQPFALGPPRPEVNVLVDAVTGGAHALDPPACAPRLPYPSPRSETIRFRFAAVATEENFDQTGIQALPAPPDHSDQGELFADDFAQADPANEEPAFWTDPECDDSPFDEGVHPDSPDSTA